MRALVFLLALTTAATAQHLRDPHASITDVPPRQTYLASTKTPALLSSIHALPSCVALPVVPGPTGAIDIPHHYLTGSNGPTNPAEAEAAAPYYAFERRISAGTNQWLAHGTEEEAQCALAQLDLWANAKALLNYDHKESTQSWFQVEWTTCSAGIADSLLVADPKLDQAQQTRVNAWLNEVAHRLISWDKPGGNNHHYWRGLAATAVGVATNDDSLFQHGLATYKEAVDEIDSRGAFPLEMARHENAIHYQGFALQPLICIAEFATRQGIDAYGYTAHEHTLRDAINFFGRASADPSLVKPYTNDEQRTKFGRGDFAVFAFYLQRFGPKDVDPNILQGLGPSFDTRIGGSTLILAAK